MSIEVEKLAGLIDHTLLKPETKPDDVKQLCKEAIESHFCSVCILPTYVSLARELLKESDVKVCTVISFPLGATEKQIKAIETDLAIEQGADEVDMVINIGALKSGQINVITADMAAVVDAAKGRTVKAILETCLLNDDEKVVACRAAVEAGISYVKTSSGFSSGGATLDDVRLMRETVGPDIGVKASGGIKNYQTACDMVEAGANRLGTSSGIAIISGEDGGSGSY